MPLDFIFTSQGQYDYFGYTENYTVGRNYIPADLNKYSTSMKGKNYGLYPKTIASTDKMVGENKHKILTRLSPIGIDNAGRPGNVLGHHLLIESDLFKICKAGPAWLLRRLAYFESWEYQGRKAFPETIIEECDYLKIDSPPTWIRYFPDNWKGLLQQLLATVGKPREYCLIPFDPEKHSTEDILNLFYEALSWIGPEQRWNTTFSTYATEAHRNLGWQWMGIDRYDTRSLSLYNRANPLTIELPR